MIEEPWSSVLSAAVYILLAPVIGGLVAGIDRKVTARMQGRVGPPVIQPFYDVGKLFEKENPVVTTTQNFYVLSYLVFMVVAGALFFSGGDMLLVIFAFTLSHIFLVLGAYASVLPLQPYRGRTRAHPDHLLRTDDHLHGGRDVHGHPQF